MTECSPRRVAAAEPTRAAAVVRRRGGGSAALVAAVAATAVVTIGRGVVATLPSPQMRPQNLVPLDRALQRHRQPLHRGVNKRARVPRAQSRGRGRVGLVLLQGAEHAQRLLAHLAVRLNRKGDEEDVRRGRRLVVLAVLVGLLRLTLLE